ncbi:MAG: cytidylate kinase family protein [Thermoprotei archaeon]
MGIEILLAADLGAGATEVGEILSKRLKFEVWNYEAAVKDIVISSERSMSEISEMASSGEIDMNRLVASLIRDRIKSGKAIVEGRAAFLFLLEPATLKVHLVAPFQVRVLHVSDYRKIDYEKALEAVRLDDEARRSLAQRESKTDANDPTVYDVTINTAAWNAWDKIADLIVYHYNQKNFMLGTGLAQTVGKVDRITVLVGAPLEDGSEKVALDSYQMNSLGVGPGDIVNLENNIWGFIRVRKKAKVVAQDKDDEGKGYVRLTPDLMSQGFYKGETIDVMRARASRSS